MPIVLGLTVQQFIFFLVRSLNKAGEEKKLSMYNV
jgi:hypothetical protein